MSFKWDINMQCLLYKDSKMIPKIIFSLLKAGIFGFVIANYGLSSGFKAQILFAIVLAMYLYEELRNERKSTH